MNIREINILMNYVIPSIFLIKAEAHSASLGGHEVEIKEDEIFESEDEGGHREYPLTPSIKVFLEPRHPSNNSYNTISLICNKPDVNVNEVESIHINTKVFNIKNYAVYLFSKIYTSKENFEILKIEVENPNIDLSLVHIRQIYSEELHLFDYSILILPKIGIFNHTHKKMLIQSNMNHMEFSRVNIADLNTSELHLHGGAISIIEIFGIVSPGFKVIVLDYKEKREPPVSRYKNKSIDKECSCFMIERGNRYIDIIPDPFPLDNKRRNADQLKEPLLFEDENLNIEKVELTWMSTNELVLRNLAINLLPKFARVLEGGDVLSTKALILWFRMVGSRVCMFYTLRLECDDSGFNFENVSLEGLRVNELVLSGYAYKVLSLFRKDNTCFGRLEIRNDSKGLDFSDIAIRGLVTKELSLVGYGFLLLSRLNAEDHSIETLDLRSEYILEDPQRIEIRKLGIKKICLWDYSSFLLCLFNVEKQGVINGLFIQTERITLKEYNILLGMDMGRVEVRNKPRLMILARYMLEKFEVDKNGNWCSKDIKLQARLVDEKIIVNRI
eukprot:GHVP01069160.1.p1 GENE.GHVP01069160.1~~GHVP01069160.1.p1  ORF type:complete len:557 (+),score=71.19 GHVP01069160.1:1018-2688(+)